MVEKPKLEVEFYSNVIGGSGYGVGAENIIKEFLKKKLPIKFSARNTHIFKFCDPMVRDFVMHSPQKQMDNPIKLFKTTPDAIDIDSFSRAVNITVFECDGICKNWANIANIIPLTIVSTEFNKRGWIDSGVDPTKVEVVGEAVDTEIFNPEVKPLDLTFNNISIIEKYPIRFIAIAQYINRKNFSGLLDVFIKAFEGRDDICLILKTNIGDSLAPYKYPLEKINAFIFSQTVPDEIMASLMATSTHYVSVSHGEGWDLNCFAAGAMKKTVVVPNHSAYAEYLTNDNAFLINSKKVKAGPNPPFDRYFQGLNWWDIDIDDAVDKLRESIKSDNLDKKEKFYEKVKEYSWSKSVDKIWNLIIERFGDIR